jgi:peptidyl-dipeptidase Dcp
MKRHLSVLLASGLALAGCTQNTTTQPAAAPASPSSSTAATPAPASSTAMTASNPFFAPSPLPFQAPDFSRIRDTDYQPAFEEGMKQELAAAQTIANQAAPPTFENTIMAMERSGDVLRRTVKVFYALTGSNTNDTLQKIEADVSPKLAAHQDEIYMNPKLFARVKSLYDRRDTLGLDAEGKFLVERYYKNFVRAGAQLSEADKTSLRALNQEESKLTTQFREKVLADTNESAIVISDRSELEGLSDAEVAAAADEAKERKLEGKWVLALRNTTQQPLLQSLKNRSVRQRLLAASMARGNHGGPNDTKAIVSRLAQLRAERARLLGYPTYAAYALDDQMAATSANAIKLLTDLVPAATAKATGEVARMQQVIDAQNGGFKLSAADWDFYAEQVRKAEYDLDTEQVKPYFELNNVLQNGVFYAANQLYGLTFKERKDIPVYHPDVRVWEVFDADGSSLALYYADNFARASKSGGAWMDTFVDQNSLSGTKPVVFNVTNFQKPAAGQPALISFDDVTTLFHEFGHALHGMFSNVKYPTFASTAVPRDFVEFPSQFNEHWALEPRVFANYAKHYQTGAPMPQELVDKIKKSRTFNQGYATTEYLSAALLDMAWHTLPAGSPLQDPNTFEQQALTQFRINMPEVPPRYHTGYFSHIWGGGYSAGYYAYLWSEVIDDDAYYWFREHGGMTRENGQRFRDMVLSRGGTQDAASLYRAFRGRDPQVQPLLEERGLVPATK